MMQNFMLRSFTHRAPYTLSNIMFTIATMMKKPNVMLKKMQKNKKFILICPVLYVLEFCQWRKKREKIYLPH